MHKIKYKLKIPSKSLMKKFIKFFYLIFATSGLIFSPKVIADLSNQYSDQYKCTPETAQYEAKENLLKSATDTKVFYCIQNNGSIQQLFFNPTFKNYEIYDSNYNTKKRYIKFVVGGAYIYETKIEGNNIVIYSCEGAPDMAFGYSKGKCRTSVTRKILATKRNLKDINVGYLGDYLNGKMHGKGSYKFADGTMYTGYFKNDQIHGNGRMKYINGDSYIGEFVNGKINGQGTYSFSSGDKYEGTFKDGLKTGSGTFFYSNGDKYIGQWKDDKKHGQGTLTWANGDKYVGDFVDGNFHGKGTYYWKDGGNWSGIWENDKQIKGKVSF